ncbi:MAG TPA: recombinase family protein [Bradyrhizobium sp.]|nr:recombinase family protein [Bradyrhizobium sp.]
MEKGPVEFGREWNALFNHRCGVQEFVERDLGSFSRLRAKDRDRQDLRRQGPQRARINSRNDPQKLIADVQERKADFDVILVYDVSRWGRFQDVDESAYYEFIRKKAGIQVLYCAEQFENDGSLSRRS